MSRLIKLVHVALLLSLAVSSHEARPQSGEPSRDPILRIETGMHTAIIKRIGVDAANRFLVTASDDKTLRLWELPSGRPLRVIRAPIGAGNEGKLNAVAISPDATTIAAGGWTVGGESGENIYLFDRESGKLLRRLGGLPEVVNHLVYSPDGRYLAAMFGGKHGVRVFQTRDYSPAGEDRDYGSRAYSADFDRAGRLATTCDDGFVRLYALAGDGALRLVAKQKAAGGDRPLSVSFSPDGSRIAVGFEDSTRVAVLSGRDLSPLDAPDTSGVSGDLGNVAWSADGKTLYAGGRGLDANNRKFIRVWANGGRGAHRDIAVVASDIILHILPLRDGGIIYGAGDPAFGVLDAGGKHVLFTSSAIVDFRWLQQGFLLSPDGAVLGFAYERFGKSLARFSLAEHRLDTAPAAGGVSWRPPATEADGLRVTDWLDTFEPKLNGARLKLEPYERSRSLAIAADASHFLLGTNYCIRLFDRSGAEWWNVSAPGVAWAVNLSADGKLAVAAYSDGTIRWYSMKDGRELLAFFPHADKKRWVVWTPSGYYDAAPGAEDLIGWHVNNGKDKAADFFPAGQFRETFYRPDVVSKILQTGDEALALRQANEEAGRKQQQADLSKLLPPVVEIVSPSDNAEVSAREVMVRFNVRTPSGEPVTGVKVLVDGRPASQDRGVGVGVGVAGQAAGVRELKVSLPEKDSEVSIIAENRYAASTPSTIRIKWRGQVVSHEFVVKPKLYVLAIGVSKYANASLRLNYAAKDARDFAAALAAQKDGLYRDVAAKILTDEAATKDEILDALDWITKETTSKDVAMVFLAGHGVNDQIGQYYFLPFNADTEKLKRSGVAFSDIRSTVEALAGKTLFFVDTCHSGNAMGSRRGNAAPDITGLVNELASAENGAVVFAASTGNQYSLEDAAWGNGAFTKALIEGLNGGADYQRQGKITINMLDLYISERVKALTKGRQTPTTTKPHTISDFPVAVKR